MANSFEESPIFELIALETGANVPSPSPPRPIPHYWGHRERLRQRFREGGVAALPDYELMELILFRAIPRRDVKPLAKTIIERFGSFAEAAAAPPERLCEIPGVNDIIATEIKLVHAAALRVAKGELIKRPTMASMSAVVGYLRSVMAFETTEQFRVSFLDMRNKLLADEVQSRGSINHTPVYVRELIKRALELSASAVILAHNHPSGDPAPSNADIEMTEEIMEVASKLHVTVHDHIIIGREGHFSMKTAGVFERFGKRSKTVRGS